MADVSIWLVGFAREGKMSWLPHDPAFQFQSVSIGRVYAHGIDGLLHFVPGLVMPGATHITGIRVVSSQRANFPMLFFAKDHPWSLQKTMMVFFRSGLFSKASRSLAHVHVGVGAGSKVGLNRRFQRPLFKNLA